MPLFSIDYRTSPLLCADDYGLHAGISGAIRALAQRQRIDAASCMTGGADWAASAPALKDMPAGFGAGLHLTLTELGPLGPMPHLAPDGRFPALGRLMRLALSGQLRRQEIHDEAQRQADAFVTATGRAPSHIDGHQHVHVFPGIREAVLALAKTYNCPVRQCGTPLAAMLTGRAAPAKALAVNLMGRGFQTRLVQAGLAHNRTFFGLCSFDPATDIAARYARWLAASGPGTLINCHPGDGLMPDDPIGRWRKAEYDYLAGDGFASLRAAEQWQAA